MDNKLTPSHRLYLLPVILVLLFLVTGIETASWGREMMRYAGGIITFVTCGVMLCTMKGKRPMELKLGVLMLVWFFISRPLNGDVSLRQSYFYAVLLTAGMMVALPFAAWAGNEKKKTIRLTISIVVALMASVAAWVGIYSALTMQDIQIFGLSPTLIDPHEKRLFMFSMHPNIGGALCAVGLASLLYALSMLKKRVYILPAVVLGAGLIWAIALTVSRTAMLECAIFLGAALGLWLLNGARSPIRQCKKPLRITALFITTVVVAAVSYMGMNGLITLSNTSGASSPIAAVVLPSANAQEDILSRREALIAKRDLSTDLATFTGRTDIYRATIPAIKERPITLLTGNLDATMMDLPNKYSGASYKYNHMHNSFLQTLMLLGLPGLALAIWMTVLLILRIFKIFFSGRYAMNAQMLALIMCIFLVHGQMEDFIFVNIGPLGFLFYLFFGLIITTQPKRPAAIKKD